jgi:signal transduction histidine kinase
VRELLGQVEVSPGIKEKIERIFDLFYTTQPTGLGFGLWWVKTFLEQQGGAIVVESRPDEHTTTFTITCPAICRVPCKRDFLVIARPGQS